MDGHGVGRRGKKEREGGECGRGGRGGRRGRNVRPLDAYHCHLFLISQHHLIIWPMWGGEEGERREERGREG